MQWLYITQHLRGLNIHHFRKQAELLKNESIEVDLDAVSKITAQDFEDASKEELENFKFADIETGYL